MNNTVEVKGVASRDLFGWISMSERPPDIGQMVWLHEKGNIWIGSRDDDGFDGWLWGNSYGTVWHNGEKWDGDCYQDYDYNPTEWHPLPSLPVRHALNIRRRPFLQRLLFVPKIWFFHFVRTDGNIMTRARISWELAIVLLSSNAIAMASADEKTPTKETTL